MDRMAESSMQVLESVAIGHNAGASSQEIMSVAIGSNSCQQARAVAIGRSAGESNQGWNAVAIGTNAGRLNQGSNSIIISAIGNDFSPTTANSFFVVPMAAKGVRTGFVTLHYNVSTGEIAYGT